MPARDEYDSLRPKPFIRTVLEEEETKLRGMTSGQPGYAAMVSHISSLRERADLAENDPTYGAPPAQEAPQPAQPAPAPGPGPGIQFARGPGGTALQQWSPRPDTAPGTAIMTGPQGAQQIEQLPVTAPRQGQGMQSPPNPFQPMKGAAGQDVFGTISRILEVSGIIQASAAQAAQPDGVAQPAEVAEAGAQGQVDPMAGQAPAQSGQMAPAGQAGQVGPMPIPEGVAGNPTIREWRTRERQATSAKDGSATDKLIEAYIAFKDAHGDDQFPRLKSRTYDSDLLAMYEDIKRTGKSVYDAAMARTGEEASYMQEYVEEEAAQKAAYKADYKSVDPHIARIVGDKKMPYQEKSRLIGKYVERWKAKHGDDPMKMPPGLRAAWELRNEKIPYVRLSDVPEMTDKQATMVNKSITAITLGRERTRKRGVVEVGGEGTSTTVTERVNPPTGTIKGVADFGDDEDAYLSALYSGSTDHEADGLKKRFEDVREWFNSWAASQKLKSTTDQRENLARLVFEDILHNREINPNPDLLKAWKKYDGVAKKEAEEKPVPRGTPGIDEPEKEERPELIKERDELRAIADEELAALPDNIRRNADPDIHWTSWLPDHETTERARWLEREIRGEPHPEDAAEPTDSRLVTGMIDANKPAEEWLASFDKLDPAGRKQAVHWMVQMKREEALFEAKKKLSQREWEELARWGREAGVL